MSMVEGETKTLPSPEGTTCCSMRITPPPRLFSVPSAQGTTYDKYDNYLSTKSIQSAQSPPRLFSQHIGTSLELPFHLPPRLYIQQRVHHDYSEFSQHRGTS
uniref:Uncharacterized protein n=1 Tax=Cacopsylla melanoneura TaxID=428564 RepID=A0A8D9E4C2_9HEMI